MEGVNSPTRRGNSPARLLASVLGEATHERDVELTEHWNLMDPQIMAVLLAMTTDLNEGSPAGRLYGDALVTALAIHLLHRYAVRRHTPATYRGGLPGYRLKRVFGVRDAAWHECGRAGAVRTRKRQGTIVVPWR
jgi:hypothetical protein